MRAAGVGNNEGVAMGAHAIGSLLDQDELIAHERDNLKQLQEEWKDKLRKAEVELSVERAKIARERADMQGQLKQLEQAKDKESTQPGNGDSKPSRGNWLSRLGLKDGEE